MLSKGLMLATLGLCIGNAPVAPLVEGSFEGVLEATRAARRCGFMELRVQVHGEVTLMFDEGGPTYGGAKSNGLCLARWTRDNSEGLSIAWVPREPAAR